MTDDARAQDARALVERCAAIIRAAGPPPAWRGWICVVDLQDQIEARMVRSCGGSPRRDNAWLAVQMRDGAETRRRVATDRETGLCIYSGERVDALAVVRWANAMGHEQWTRWRDAGLVDASAMDRRCEEIRQVAERGITEAHAARFRKRTYTCRPIP
jgi:hypothetical protein